jgi:hypothetical protein
MPYFKNINILFIHIPKTGGTSVENYFYKKFNIEKTFDTLYSNLQLTLNSHSLQHSTYCELFEKSKYFNIDFTNLTILSIVRNPYERLISDLFFYGLINSKSSKEEIYKQIVKFLNSNDFIYDNHKMEQYKYLIDNQGNINKNIIIMKTETLTMNMVENNFDDFNNDDNVSYRNKINYIDLLNDDSISFINNYYKRDFEYFEYEMILR